MTIKRKRRSFNYYDTTVEVSIDMDDVIEQLIDNGYTVIPPDEPGEWTPQCSESIQDLVEKIYLDYVLRGTIPEEKFSKLFYEVLGKTV